MMIFVKVFFITTFFWVYVFLGFWVCARLSGWKVKSNKYRKENSLSNWSTSARGAGNNQDFIEEDMMVLIVSFTHIIKVDVTYICTSSTKLHHQVYIISKHPKMLGWCIFWEIYMIWSQNHVKIAFEGIYLHSYY